MSTPTTLELPPGVRRTAVVSPRGEFSALEALPASGATELGTALLVPGYTGSKEDFINVLSDLARAGRRVLAVDQRGQYETPGPDDPAAYTAAALGTDIAALAAVTQARHLLGHSFGGLMVREAVLTAGLEAASLTLLSSGPAAIPGPRAERLASMLDFLGPARGEELRARVAEAWHRFLGPEAEQAGASGPILAFLRERMLKNNPVGLVAMAREILSAEDRTKELAEAGIPAFVLYGEDDDAWPAAVQEDMAVRLGARRLCIPAAAHSPAVEAPATTAQALTGFWNTAEGVTAGAATRI
ncbi:MAG: alpha/beta fold hydrolase [Nocardiopsaceae bacterium]|nr:alpha/beta fold hydrolase [Nocardiopsaceae bacterium]